MYFCVQQPDDEEKKLLVEDFSDDSYLMVSQLHWEDEVVWNGDDIKHKVISI
jgi:transcription initiation factor TFIID subunit 1